MESPIDTGSKADHSDCDHDDHNEAVVMLEDDCEFFKLL